MFYRTSQATIQAGQVLRRDFLRAIPWAALTAGGMDWSTYMTTQAAELRKQGKACIVLWMQGAPSQFETFSPKPGHTNGGETKAIKTKVPGIEIAESLPEVAKIMDKLCLLRSLTSKEGSHPRATYLMHTGYIPTASVKYPTLGSIASHEIGNPALEIPSFVRIGQQRLGDSAGFLGSQHDPFLMQSADKLPENTSIPTSAERYQRRLGLLSKLESDYATKGGKQEVQDHQHLVSRTSKMILSSQMSSFDLSKETAQTRALYGDSPFAHGCLLARRLVESGVTFVEVVLGNWDTHDDNFNRSKTLCSEFDQPMAALIRDLEQRGMLDNTVVLWMGEFGRTPRINARSGRDHFPNAFNAAICGGGVRGGQVIGATDTGGETITKRPVTVPDLFRTICHTLNINADKENMSNIGRPIKIVDGGQVVKEVRSG
jgi:hypothetical protein